METFKIKDIHLEMIAHALGDIGLAINQVIRVLAEKEKLYDELIALASQDTESEQKVVDDDTQGGIADDGTQGGNADDGTQGENLDG